MPARLPARPSTSAVGAGWSAAHDALVRVALPPILMQDGAVRHVEVARVLRALRAAFGASEREWATGGGPMLSYVECVGEHAECLRRVDAGEISQDDACARLHAISLDASQLRDVVSAAARDAAKGMRAEEGAHGGWLDRTAAEAACRAEMVLQLTKVVESIRNFLRQAAYGAGAEAGAPPASAPLPDALPRDSAFQLYQQMLGEAIGIGV